LGFGLEGRQNRFYSRKQGRDELFIEKSKYRIDTFGEIAGISLKGVASQKLRRKQEALLLW
jgi:hypothetical protein